MKNWYETFKFYPSSTTLVTAVPDPLLQAQGPIQGFSVITSAQLPGFIAAEEAAGNCVRVAGSRWSSTDVMATPDSSVTLTSDGDTAMARILGCCAGGGAIISTTVPASAILPGALTASVTASGARLVHVQAGIKIHRLLEFLAQTIPTSPLGAPGKGPWTLPNMGASSGQRVIGAVSTATHGGAFERSPLADSVRALRVIGPGGSDLWLERAGSRALTTGTTLPGMPTTTVLRDDELFLAALVSVGAMGAVIELVIEALPEFGMSQRCAMRPWSDVSAALENGNIFLLAEDEEDKHPSSSSGSIQPEGLEILINPYRIDDNYDNPNPERNCRVVYRAMRVGVPADPTDPPPQGLPDLDGIVSAALDGPLVPAILGASVPELGLNALALFIAFEMGLLPLYRAIIDIILESQRSDTDDFPPTHRVLETYDGTGVKPPGLSLELAIPTTEDRHLALLNALLDDFDQLIREGKRYAGFFSVRITRPSAASMAMQNSWEAALAQDTGPQICHIEIFALKDISLEIDGVDTDQNGDMENSTERFFRAFVARARRHGARLHWGQIHFLDRQDVIIDYPTTLHGWRRARTRLCSLAAGGSWRTFSNAHSRRTGLESYHEAVTALVRNGATDVFTLRLAATVLTQTLGAGGASTTFNTSSAPICTPLTAAMVRIVPIGHGASPTVEAAVFGETVDGRVAWVRAGTSGTLPLSAALTRCSGPWSAVDDGTEIHLVAVEGNGMRWLRAPDLFGTWTSTNVGVNLGGDLGVFAHTISACVDPAGTTHVVGYSTRRHLICASHSAGIATWTFRLLTPLLHPTPGGVLLPELTGPVTAVATAANFVHVFGVSPKGEILHLFGDVTAGGLLEWETIPIAVLPAVPYQEFEAQDPGDDSGYQVIPTVLRLSPRPLGPLAVVNRAGELDLIARTDRGSLVHITRSSSGQWGLARLLP